MEKLQKILVIIGVLLGILVAGVVIQSFYRQHQAQVVVEEFAFILALSATDEDAAIKLYNERQDYFDSVIAKRPLINIDFFRADACLPGQAPISEEGGGKEDAIGCSSGGGLTLAPTGVFVPGYFDQQCTGYGIGYGTYDGQQHCASPFQLDLATHTMNQYPYNTFSNNCSMGSTLSSYGRAYGSRSTERLGARMWESSGCRWQSGTGVPWNFGN